MGPLRRGLIHAAPVLAALPGPALAEVCDKIRPDWDGTPVSGLQEALQLALTAPVLALLIATGAALRFRSQWGGLIVVVLWTGYASLLSFGDLRTQAQAEGCAGSPTLFIGLVAAICVATILYTAPVKPGPPDGET